MERVNGSYQADYDRFLLHSKNYIVQYNQAYLQRFQHMKKDLRSHVERKWGSAVPILNQIIEIEHENYRSQECVLIGMIYKDLKLRGSILDDFKEGSGIQSSLQPLANLASDKDLLILEDHSGRVSITGSLQNLAPVLVTGLIIAVRGTLSESGEFIVSDHLFNYELQVDPDSVLCSSVENAPLDGKYVLFVSGLSIGSNEVNQIHDISVQLLVDFISGKYGDENIVKLASRIMRVIIAGDSVIGPEQWSFKERFSLQKDKDTLANPSKQLDLWLAQLLGSCYVDILPGMTDPANVALPQQPFHPCLFPHSSRFNSLERVPNPMQCKLDNIVILGHSGQPLNDIARQSYEPEGLQTSMVVDEEPEPVPLQTMDTMETDVAETIVELDPKPTKVKSNLLDGERRMNILQQTLEWGHLAPTIPDTMPAYPFADNDPFVIEPKNVPNIFFAGNQPSFSSRLVKATNLGSVDQNVRLICIPKFKETGTVVLCDISQKNLPCYLLRFS